MFVKRVKKNMIETINLGSITSDYIQSVYGKREEAVHRAIERLAEAGAKADDALKHNLIRRVKVAAGMPPTMRIEVRARRMGAYVYQLEKKGKNRFERFRFSTVAGLADLDDFTRASFLALVRDSGLRAALAHFKGRSEHKQLKKAVAASPEWWEPGGVWTRGIEALQALGIFPAEAFLRPRDRK